MYLNTNYSGVSPNIIGPALMSAACEMEIYIFCFYLKAGRLLMLMEPG